MVGVRLGRRAQLTLGVDRDGSCMRYLHATGFEGRHAFCSQQQRVKAAPFWRGPLGSSSLPAMAAISGRVWRSVALLVSLSGCGTQTTAQPAEAPASPSGGTAELSRLSIRAIELEPLTPDEHALEASLRKDVAEVLSAGERHVGNEWGLAVATDNLAAQLEALDLAVEREGFVGADGALAQNLIVHLRGDPSASELVLVGARFDSVPGSPGADDNASGVAALLSLARYFKDKPRHRSLRLVWFSDASGRKVPESMGAWQHLQRLVGGRPRSANEEPEEKPSLLHACIEVHGLGVYDDALNSQRYPEGLPAGHPIGEFVEVAAMAQDSALGQTFVQAMGGASSVPIKGVTWLDPPVSEAMTGLRAFTEHHCPALLISDTQRRRFAGFGTAEDTVQRLEFGRLARAVKALTVGVENLLNAPASNSASPAREPVDTDAPTSGVGPYLSVKGLRPNPTRGEGDPASDQSRQEIVQHDAQTDGFGMLECTDGARLGDVEHSEEHPRKYLKRPGLEHHESECDQNARHLVDHD